VWGFFASFVNEHFAKIFTASGKKCNVFLQDGDPSQNSARAVKEITELGYTIMSIPPRSPDLNPIENIFNIFSTDAIKKNITSETKESFHSTHI